MKRIILLLFLISSINNLYAQHEWVLKPWMQVYGDTVDQHLGTQVGYLGKKGDTTIIGVSEAIIYDGVHYRVKLYYVKTQADTIPRCTYIGRDCLTGDFNGDGIHDLVVAGNPTRIYLAHEEGVFDTIPFFEKYGEGEYNAFGRRISAGKINGDDIDDLIISDLDYPDGFRKGRVYIFYGETEMDTIPARIIEGEYNHAGLGWNLATGDLNNDGFDEIIIRGYDNKSSIESERFCYTKIYLGGNTADTTAWKYIKGHYYYSYFGVACYDINGDGVKDLLWSNYSVKDSMPAVHIHYSKNGDIDTVPSLLLPNDWAMNIADAGDMNGDGYNDILISGNSSDQAGHTYVFVYSGGPKMDTHFDAGFGLIGYSDLGSSGSISGVGDINNDGYDDILVGARGYEWYKNYGGWIILQGSPNIPVTSVKQTDSSLPKDFSLNQNYPNPFNPTTTIEYTIKNSSNVTLIVYNLLGEEVKTLVKEYQNYGSYKAEFNAEGLPSGTYYYTLTLTGEDGISHSLTKQMILLK